MRHAHQITITIETSNDAFEDNERGEVGRLIRTAARMLSDSIAPAAYPLQDINGNTVGHVEVTRDD